MSIFFQKYCSVFLGTNQMYFTKVWNPFDNFRENQYFVKTPLAHFKSDDRYIHAVNSGKHSYAFCYTGEKSIYSEAEICEKDQEKCDAGDVFFSTLISKSQC